MLHKVEDVLKKKSYCDELKCECDMHSAIDLAMCLGDIMDMLSAILMDLLGCMEGIVLVRGIWKDKCYLSFVCRRNYVCHIHGLKERERER